ncbi:ubiquitin-related domain-containing protein [Crepidotus variabilis]|uniref:Ubiquitin-related domain-containing protein n=1 Tax=Crepidotus variabilis TaxID=179855 RepID=A0A9P6EA57_9AGAR|nr:ubiquitin-related domain-containing protein [Crepidotus variabilis]
MTGDNEVSGPSGASNNENRALEVPLRPPVPHFAAGSSGVHDALPSSARTSFTHVNHDEDEHRPRQSLAQEPSLAAVSAMAHSAQNATNGSSELQSSTSGAVGLEGVPLDPQSKILETSMSPQLTSTSPTQPHEKATAEEEAVPQMPQTYVTFLLISGRRRTMSFEPETTIGRVKELVWNSWPSDWQDERPPAPSYLRVLYLGRMLQDDETLSKLKLPVSVSAGPTPTIMHISIRPIPPPGEGDMKKKKRRGIDETGNEEQAGGAGCCRCVIC